MQINAYLHFNGHCEEAFNFYATLFHGKIETMMLHGNSPVSDHTPLDWHGKVLHCKLIIGSAVLMGADAHPEQFEKPQGFSVSLNLTSTKETERIFSSLSVGGTVELPLEETFWAARFGMVTDRFGTPWMLNCEAVEGK